MKARILRALLVPALACAAIAVTSTPAHAVPAGCASDVKPGTTVTSLKHWIYCGDGGWAVAANEVIDTSNPADAADPLPDSGGPACTWDEAHFNKFCADGRGHPWAIVWTGGSEGHPTDRFWNWNWVYPQGVSGDIPMLDWVADAWKFHTVRLCTTATAVGVFSAAIVLTVTTGGLAGAAVAFVSSAGGGCIAGALNDAYAN